MHELGIVFHVIKTVERVGAENDLTRVAGVTLELGEVCGAIPRELVSCWDWAVQKSDLLRGAQLHIDTLPAGQTGDFLMDGAQLFRGDPGLFDRVVQAGPHLLLPILCVTRLCEPLQAVREFVADAAYFVDPSTPHLLRERFGVERGEEFDDLFRIVFAASAQTVKVAELRRTDDRIDPVRPVEEQRVRSQCAGEKRVFGEFVRLRKNGEHVVCRRGVEKIGKFSLSALGGGGHRQGSCPQEGEEELRVFCVKNG